MANPDVLSVNLFINTINESNKNNKRFCFILGSGASVESGIPTGNKLEMDWMDWIMDPKINNVDDFRDLAKELHEKKLIRSTFDELQNEWNTAKKGSKSIDSKYYSDIYTLRFYPDISNGYGYLEKLMERSKPSIGYHTLSHLLTHKNLNNFVITTNFDSLVEDSLFIYTDKKPLVISHESLAKYIDPSVRRPIIAKVHRGIMFEPFNDPQKTSKLEEEWKKPLNDALKTYIPIVIGYAGGDKSLMSFLESESEIKKGLYWCYREDDGLPPDNILEFVENNKGHLVPIEGFDSLMVKIGAKLYPENVGTGKIEEFLGKQLRDRVTAYNDQYTRVKDKEESLASINEREAQDEEKREGKENLTYWDFFNRGYKYGEEGDYDKAIANYTEAIKRNPDYAAAYNNRGFAYNNSKESQKDIAVYNKAIADFNKAIELNPDFAEAYNNRGISYNNLEEYQKDIADFNKAIELNPDFAEAYNNRGVAYHKSGKHDKAIADYNKAIELNPDYTTAYENRALAYRALGKEDLAKADEERASKL
ncbi:MAG: tetratricopeptide repeat protein [Firmicutes bacterium]|nr:tetratricopeptide repeat protein [Bacillota bacterium]